MNTKGLRISDLKEGKCIPLSELLASIPHENHLTWALLWFDVTPIENKGKLLTELQKKVNESEDGLPFTFESLVELSYDISQEIEILIIGCQSKKNVHRYKDDQKMYEHCDIVIEMIDGGFWEIFSNKVNWIDLLGEKYKEVEFLKPNFQKEIPKN